MTETIAEGWPLRRGSLIYPSPVAIACGRVLRARTPVQRVSACLKAAEVLTRYLAAVAVASFASRDDGAEGKFSELDGNLSFGHFLTTVQEVTAAKGEHPARQPLRYAFRFAKKELGSGATNESLTQLLGLRNRLGHELATLDDTRAGLVEAEDRPVDALVRAVAGAEGLLALPLFVVEHQEWTKEAIMLRRLLLMGESFDPAPTFAAVRHDSGVGNVNTPYVAIGQSCVQLPPWLLWGIDYGRKNLSLLFLDGVEEGKATYCTIDGSKQEMPGHHATTVRDLLLGATRPSDTILLLDGRHLAEEWADARERIVETGRRQEGLVDWQAFDSATVNWFASLLQPDPPDPHALIRERLLDGRYHVEPEELRQLTLLFGRGADVRARLQRDMLDLRVIDPNTMRPAKRALVESANLLVALKRAVQFFAEQTGMGEVAADDLRKTEGSLNYLTLREIFVNQAVHQDYRDSSAAGQIEIHPEKVTVFNTGYSLVPTDKLLDGGKSQSRNPLIARALRLIGFAEISGSGIRAVHRACQRARLRAPTFESNRDANTFSLTLDWSEGTTDVDTYWQTLVGAHLTQRQAAVLNAIADAPSVTIAVIESATGLDADSIVEALDFLLLQVLIEQDESNYRLVQHLREKLG